MSPDALLEHAAALLKRVLRFDQPADGVLSGYFREHHVLGGRERATLSETAYAVVRRRSLLQHLAASGRGPLERRLAILGWQGNAGFLRAALSADERAWVEHVDSIDRSTLPERLRHNMPEWLAERLQAALGDDFGALVDALDRPAPLDLRVNALRAKREQVQHELAARGVEAAPTRWAPHGLRVTGKPALQTFEVFKRGDVEVQDEGSQLVAALVGARRGEMVVDFCAGAGGKTLALGVDMRSTGRLYAFDTSGHRLAALKPRLARSGLSNVYPVQIAHERDERIKRLAGKIDRVLVDAPCSGLGTLRRNPDLKWRQTPGSIAEMRVKQEAILFAAATLLRPGGRLVYATCSLLEQENEDVATAFDVARRDTFVGVPAEDALERAHVPDAAALVRGPYLRLWPHRHATDGFFAAVWERR